MPEDEGWLLGPGDSLVDRLSPRENRVRVGLQWLALGILVASAFSSSGLGTGPGIVVFCLIGIGLHWKRAAENAVFEGLPCLTADEPQADAPSESNGVSIFSPARNEEESIGMALRSLCASAYPRFEVFAIDDHSTDATPEIMDGLEQEFAQLRVIHDPTSQDGWTGKANAIWKALPLANPDHEWLLFTDADVVFHPRALSRFLSFAESEGLDFLTCLPRLTTGSLWEEVTLPPAWRSMICGVPYARLNYALSHPIGIGAFMLIRRDVYYACGGHSVFPDQHMEDIVIAGLVKEHGGKVGLAWTPDLLSIRLYRGFHHLVAASVNKLRVLGHDTLVRPLSVASQRALPVFLPLPLSMVALGRQLGHSEFNFWLTVYAALGVLVYLENVRLYQGARATSDMRSWIAWIHPFGGVVRLWVAVRTLFEILVDAESKWRGRKTLIRRRD